MRKTKGQVESEITESIIKFEKEYMGRGPSGCRTYILDDMVVVHLTGTMTQGEYQLANTDPVSPADERNGSPKGYSRELIKNVRRELLEKGRPLLEKCVESLTGHKVVAFHTDMSTRTGDRIVVFVLDIQQKQDEIEG
jgi:uncharacterized protein YbcI